MITEVTITVLPDDEKNKNLIEKLILKELAKKNVSAGKKHIPVFVKKSIDARHGQLKYHLRYKVFIDEEPGEVKTSALPEWKSADGKKTVIIVGSGPAGLFGALKLLEKGIKPVIVERGERTSDRKKSIAKISTQDLVDSDSNYCFGEGGCHGLSFLNVEF